MSFEALALLLAIVPMRMILDDPTGAIIAILILTVACVLLAGMAKRPWVWKAGAVVQVALISCWPLHWALGVAGIVFGAVWAYCWYVKIALGKAPETMSVELRDRTAPAAPADHRRRRSDGRS